MTSVPDDPQGTRADDETFDAWRTRLATAALVCTGFVAVVSYAGSVVQGMWPWTNATLLVLGMLCFAVAYLRRIKLEVRAAVVLTVLYVGAMVVMTNNGLTPNATVALSLGVVLAGLLLGRRAGFAFAGLSLVGLCVLWVGYRTGLLVLPPDWHRHIDGRDPLVMMRVCVIFGALATGLMLAVRYALDRTESLLRRATEASVRLRREQAERERVQAELALREQAMRKASELELLGRLAGYAAHDFNNSLMVIQGNADLARMRATDPGVLQALDSIVLAAQQAVGTARQLRTFGPQRDQPPRAMALAEQVRRASRLLHALLPSNIRVEVELHDEGAVVAGEGELQRIVLNLALNARDAMREGGQLTLRVKPAGIDADRRIALEIEDTGHGMDPATLARLFEPYFTTKGESGTGLGLASARDLVSERGGTIEVFSEQGQGTRFRIEWPRARLEPEPGSASLPPKAGAVVLVADDDAEVRKAVARTLNDAGLSTLTAGDGSDVLQTARRFHQPIDVLFTDVGLPGIPIGQLLTTFRKDHPKARVVLCSGYSPDRAAEERLGIDAFLAKPVEPNDVIVTIRALLERGSPVVAAPPDALRPR